MSSPQPFWVITNWKMNLTWGQAQALIQGYLTLPSSYALIICPPYPWLMPVHDMIREISHVALGAQDCSAHDQGAFTGEVSASMVQESGCTYVLIGHSERRKGHHENSHQLSCKITQAIHAGLVPVLCIGESSVDAPLYTLHDQLAILDHTFSLSSSPALMVAYEPVWAIGTGETPSPQHVQKALDVIRFWFHAKQYPVPSLLYGGSVNASNAASFQSMCNGLLIGGASLNMRSFRPLVEALV